MVPFAQGYRLLYAPYPAADVAGTADLGRTSRLDAVLPVGSDYYIAIQAYNKNGDSVISNIEFFQIRQQRYQPVFLTSR